MNNQFDDILKRYEAARSAGSSIYLEPDDLTDIAEYYHLHGRLTDAIEAIDLAINMFPGATQPLTFKARVAILVNRNAAEAMQWAEKIDDKTDLDYYYIVAEIMVADQRIDEANQYLKAKETMSAMTTLKTTILTWLPFCRLLVHRHNRRVVEKSSLTTDPQYRELQGRVALGKGQFDLCEQIFDKLIDDNPYNTDYWNTMALAQFQQGDTTACIESCDYALAIDPVNADAHIHKANSLAIIGNYPEAIKCYKKLQALQPYSESPDMGIASILAAQNHPQEALAHLKTAEKLATSTSPNKLEILRQQCILNANWAIGPKRWPASGRWTSFPTAIPQKTMCSEATFIFLKINQK